MVSGFISIIISRPSWSATVVGNEVFEDASSEAAASEGVSSCGQREDDSGRKDK